MPKQYRARQVRYYQTGKTNLERDKKLKAKPPGKRKSATGNIYYENRRNRSDIPGDRKQWDVKQKIKATAKPKPKRRTTRQTKLA